MWREKLLGMHGAAGSRRRWWSFEGFTSVDCCLETDRLILFVEGKRTAPLAAATEWYPWRREINEPNPVLGTMRDGAKEL